MNQQTRRAHEFETGELYVDGRVVQVSTRVVVQFYVCISSDYTNQLHHSLPLFTAPDHKDTKNQAACHPHLNLALVQLRSLTALAIRDVLYGRTIEQKHYQTAGHGILTGARTTEPLFVRWSVVAEIPQDQD